MQRITIQEVLSRRFHAAVAQQARNAEAMRRVAAGVPQPRLAAPQGASTSREAASPGRETASTTTTHSGGLSGCSSQSA